MKERGLRFDDPWMNIDWPVKPQEVSAKDANWPLFNPEWHGIEAMRGAR